MLESDIRFTKDNVPILYHDEDLVRITGKDEKVRKKTLEELLQFDLGYILKDLFPLLGTIFLT